MVRVAALFVATDGCYFGLPDVDPWDVTRDARLYPGPHPVVAHPPCERWGRYWHGGPSARMRKTKGDDGGCFASALESVRRWGGVLEHPEASAAWLAFGLVAPRRFVGWEAAGDFRGWTCCIEQGHYGHRARKATWLYASGIASLPSLRWEPSIQRVKLDDGYHSAEERRKFRRLPKGASPELRAERNAYLARVEAATGRTWCSPERMGKRERAATPVPFRDLLLSIAQSVEPVKR
jgi:hypothetical protein